MNTAAGRVHLAGQHAIAGTGGQAEAAVHAGVGSASGKSGERAGRGLSSFGMAHGQSLDPQPVDGWVRPKVIDSTVVQISWLNGRDSADHACVITRVVPVNEFCFVI